MCPTRTRDLFHAASPKKEDAQYSPLGLAISEEELNSPGNSALTARQVPSGVAAGVTDAIRPKYNFEGNLLSETPG